MEIPAEVPIEIVKKHYETAEYILKCYKNKRKTWKCFCVDAFNCKYCPWLWFENISCLGWREKYYPTQLFISTDIRNCPMIEKRIDMLENIWLPELKEYIEKHNVQPEKPNNWR